MRAISSLFALLAATALSSCGLVYKMEINQGNLRHRDMVAKLKERADAAAGRSWCSAHRPPKACSTRIAGTTPIRWSGAARRSPRTKLTVVFADEKLKSWTVADLPTSPVVDRDPAYAISRKDKKAGRRPGLVVAHRRLVAQVARGRSQSRHRRLSGRMGRMLFEAAAADRDCTLVGALDASGSPAQWASRRGVRMAMPTCW